MKNTYSETKVKKGSRRSRFPLSLAIKCLALTALLLTGLSSPLQAQEAKYTRPSWWFGVAGGPNINFFRGSTQRINADVIAPVAFQKGLGLGLYAAPLVEFYRPGSVLGLMFQAGYDSRKGSFNTVLSPCNCPRDLSTKLSYVTVEPNLRIAPFRSNFFLYIGPRVAYNLEKSFVYEQGTNPDYPEQEEIPDVSGDLSMVNEILVSGQVGAGLDIPLSSKDRHTQFMLSPFVSYHPFFGQNPRSIETWSMQTVRAGIALKFGRGQENPNYELKDPVENVVLVPIVEPEVIEPEVVFTVYAPRNIPEERIVREVFPLRNYVFFDAGSSQIPARYVLLDKNQVKDFKTDQVELFTPENMSGRSKRQMIVYYNILNILGDRMVSNPTTTITLVGSSEKGTEDALAMASSVRRYLVDVFGIEAGRISLEGRTKPLVPGLENGGTKDVALLKAGDRRVSIESKSPVLLMEFLSGPNAALKPVEVVAVEKAPLESYVSFEVAGADEALDTWTLEMEDENGAVQYFGPYTGELIMLPGKDVLGDQPNGDYMVTMVGQTKSGKTVKKYSMVNMVRWTPPVDQEVMRFSVIYEFDESKAITMYDTYLTEVVVPKIPQGGTVIIHGYTDNIGYAGYNQYLSRERAMDVKTTLEKGLAKAGRNDVKFEVFGFGEDPDQAPFENKYPEEHFYNRTVLIDIVPPK